MRSAAAEYRDTIDHLPPGASFVVHHVDWHEYEDLAGALAHRTDLRVSYDAGRLEIMSPSPEHEAWARLIDAVVRLHLERRGTAVEQYGSATWKRPSARRAVEPDGCFYVANAARVIGRRIDLESDPPPDVVVEIDVANESLAKFPIYAALGVPEIWRYDGKVMEFHALGGATYHRMHESQQVAGLTAAMLQTVLDDSRTAGQTQALRAFRERAQAGQG